MNQTLAQVGAEAVELPGGEALFEALAEQISKSSEDGTSVSIALVDLDKVGAVNEEHGAETGDVVLQAVVRRLAELIVAGAPAQTFRIAGDEFALLLPGVEKEDAFLLLERERSDFSGNHQVSVGTRKLVLPLSFGAAVSTYPEDGVRPQDVMRKASDALYRAKSTGSNKVCLAREERMVTKTSHYTQAQLARLSTLAKREGVGEADLLREALDDLLRRYGV